MAAVVLMMQALPLPKAPRTTSGPTAAAVALTVRAAPLPGPQTGGLQAPREKGNTSPAANME